MLFSRYYYLNKPIESLNEMQKRALNKFNEKLICGIYSFEEVSCPCGNKEGRLIAKRDRYALPVNTYLCKSCGIMWTNPRMSYDSLTKFYEGDYRSIYTGQEQCIEDFFTAQVQSGKAIYNFIKTTIKMGQRLSVFDVGCGGGGVLVPFVEAGWRSFGCDVGNEYLKYGRSMGLTLEQGDVNVLTKYGKTNLVILNHVLEHLVDIKKSLKQISQILTEDGYLYVELPGIFNIHRSYRDFLLFLQNAHLYHFTLTTLTSLMSQLGFRLVRGDEHIRALFQKDNNTLPVSASGQYNKILLYLYFVEVNRIFRLFNIIDGLQQQSIKLVKYTLGDKLFNKVKERLRWIQA